MEDEIERSTREKGSKFPSFTTSSIFKLKSDDFTNTVQKFISFNTFMMLEGKFVKKLDKIRYTIEFVKNVPYNNEERRGHFLQGWNITVWGKCYWILLANRLVQPITKK